MTNRLKQIFLAMLFALLPFGLTQAVYLNVGDTTAGSQARLQVSGLLSEESVLLTLDRPTKSPLSFGLQADGDGVISDELYGLHLKQSGDYKVSLQRNDAPNVAADDVFVVQPGAPSRYRSEISTTLSTLPADGVALSPFKVRVADAYGNPVPGQSVSVFSSRNKDVLNVGGKTDGNGVVSGTIYSTEPGVSVLSALVAGEMLFERTELVFHLPASGGLAVGQSGLGSFLKAQLFSDDFEEVAYFSIEDIPSEVVTEQGYTFLVSAKDKNGNVVKNYEGKVRFSSDDNGAQLPIDYQFIDTDQGEHEFAVAVAFSTPGQRTLTVTDADNSELQGQVQLDVLDGNQVLEPPSGDGLIIVTPTEGTYSSPRMTITGRGPAGTPIKITDGPITLVEDLTLDVNGDFFYQTPALADGRHVFRAEFMDGSAFSNDVDIRIDNTPPRVLAVEVDPPTGVPAGGTFRVTVSSNEALSTATCTFEGAPQTLSRSGDVFAGDVVAGETCGTFPLSCTVADILGNELTENTAATIKVCGDQPGPGKDTDQDGLSDEIEGLDNDEDGDSVPDWLESDIVDSTGNGISDQKDPTNDTDGGGQGNLSEAQVGTNPLNAADDQQSNVAPTSVSNLNATPGEQQITLYWSPARDDVGVARYKILYGTDPNQLYGTNITPDPRTQWYVDQLAEATKYFFRVVAVDADGNEGTPSNLVEATTYGEVFHGAAVPESGTETNVWLPLLLALLGGGLFLIFGRKRA